METSYRKIIVEIEISGDTHRVCNLTSECVLTPTGIQPPLLYIYTVARLRADEDPEESGINRCITTTFHYLEELNELVCSLNPTSSAMRTWCCFYLGDRDVLNLSAKGVISENESGSFRVNPSSQAIIALKLLEPEQTLPVTSATGLPYGPGFHLYTLPKGSINDLVFQAVVTQTDQYREAIYQLSEANAKAVSVLSDSLIEVFNYGCHDRNLIAVTLNGSTTREAIRKFIFDIYKMPVYKAKLSQKEFAVWDHDCSIKSSRIRELRH